jgi:hypothetical protein
MREKKKYRKMKNRILFIRFSTHPFSCHFTGFFCFRVHKRWNTLVIFRYKIKEKK